MRLLFQQLPLRRYRRFRVASSYPAKHRVDMNYAALSSISRICKRIPATLGSFSWVSTQFREEGMEGSGESSGDPLFSRYFVQRRKAIEDQRRFFALARLN